jgi:hypothetical protein
MDPDQSSALRVDGFSGWMDAGRYLIQEAPARPSLVVGFPMGDRPLIGIYEGRRRLPETLRFLERRRGRQNADATPAGRSDRLHRV